MNFRSMIIACMLLMATQVATVSLCAAHGARLLAESRLGLSPLVRSGISAGTPLVPRLVIGHAPVRQLSESSLGNAMRGTGAGVMCAAAFATGCVIGNNQSTASVLERQLAISLGLGLGASAVAGGPVGAGAYTGWIGVLALSARAMAALSVKS